MDRFYHTLIFLIFRNVNPLNLKNKGVCAVITADDHHSAVICSLAHNSNGNLRKRKTPDEKMHILLLYILKYAGVDSNILQNRREYD